MIQFSAVQITPEILGLIAGIDEFKGDNRANAGHHRLPTGRVAHPRETALGRNRLVLALAPLRPSFPMSLMAVPWRYCSLRGN